jgi:drug/metabolite transporter (DMT)-like permease
MGKRDMPLPNGPGATITGDPSGANEETPLLASVNRIITPNGSQDLYSRPLPNGFDTEIAGLMAMAASALFFSLMTALAKAAGAAFPTLLVVLARSLVQAILGFFTCFFLGVSPWGPKGSRWALLSRGLAGSIGLGAYFYASM